MNRFRALVLAGTFACTAITPSEPVPPWLGFDDPVAYDGAGTTLTRLSAADVVGDVSPDLLVVARGDRSVRLFAGTPPGVLGAAATVTIGSDTRDVTAADVNGDGIADLIATGHFDNALFVRLGTGSGQFAAQTSYGLRNHGHFALRADLNGDAFGDVVAVHDGSGQPVYVTTFLGSASGQLARATELGTPHYTAKGVGGGDVDGDGRTDIAVAVADNRASVLVFLGRGDGSLAAPTALPTLSDDTLLGDGTVSLAVGDLDDDGRDDIVLTRQDVANELVVRLSRKGFGAPSRIALPSPIDVALGDVNGDGKLDAVAANLEHGSMSLLFGYGDGTFAPPRTVTLGRSPASLAVVDLNQDRRADVAATDLTDHKVRVLLSR